jgi:hypothetical protein
VKMPRSATMSIPSGDGIHRKDIREDDVSVEYRD